MVRKKKNNLCRARNTKQFEIELVDTSDSGRFDGEYGFGVNPPIVLCAKDKSDAVAQLKLPKNVKVLRVKEA